MSYRCRILGLLVLLVTTSTVSHAATFVCHDTACLVHAVHTANSNGHVSNRIVLTAGTYAFTAPAALSDEGHNALPLITSTLTLEAASPPVVLTRDPQAPLFRFAQVAEGGDVTLRRLTLEGFAVSTAFFQDGGCLHNSGTLRLVDSLVRDCEARIGGAVRSRGRLHALRSTFDHNLATFVAGALAADGPESTLRSNTFFENTAELCGAVFLLSPTDAGASARNNSFLGNTSFRGSGGALCTQGEAVEVVGGHATDNHSGLHGGAHHAFEGTLTVRGSAYTQNSAQVDGGALNVAAGFRPTQVTILQSQLLANAAFLRRGGGLHNGGDLPVLLQGSQVRHNQAPLGPDCAGPVTAIRSHIGDPTDCTLVPQ